MPGEWYLDRETGLLYIYPESDPQTAEVIFTYRDNAVITVDGGENLTLKNLTVLGSRGNAVTATGNGNLFENLTIKNVMANAIDVTGYNNTVTGCDISHTGKGGIFLRGGDRETLTAGNNIASNNYIHDWSEVYQTNTPGVFLEGVGNISTHNEFYNAPHQAMSFCGNNHLIEYNYIHHVILLTDDGGTIHPGRDWSMWGTVIRYNLITHIGDENHEPVGIYLDDAFSGTEVYGNLLYDLGHPAIEVGGGRNNSIHDNIIVNQDDPIWYDQRAREGYFDNGWFSEHVADTETGDLWVRLRSVPYQSEIWAEAYPDLAKVKDTYDDPDDPDFAPNPANAEFYNNLIFSDKELDIADYILKYGRVENNRLLSYDKYWAFFDYLENDDFTFVQPEIMPEIPVEEIGLLTDVVSAHHPEAAE